MTTDSGPHDMFRRGYAQWPTTAWTLIRNVQAAQSDDRKRFMDDLLRRYRRPLFAYFRAKRVSADDADDLVQGFLLRFVEKGSIDTVKKEKGRLRDLFMVSARNYFVDSIRKQQRIAQDGPAGNEAPADAFRDGWRRGVLERAQEAVLATCMRRDRATDFLTFSDYYLCNEAEQPTWQEIATRHSIEMRDGIEGWKLATRMADWVKEQFRRAIRDEIRFDLGDDPGLGDRRITSVTDDDIDDELRDLMG
jgi:DNA-directed RNA polymerase specialized sigma24 family protein